MFSLKKSIYKTRRDPSCECVGGEVVIGNQIWTCTNLDVTTFRNGDVIPQETDPTAWANLTTPAWCYFNNDPANGAIYGKLYNWHAVRDPRGLAPTGYHIPTDAEWTQLTDYLGGVSVAGGKMKSTGTTLWNAPNTLATNESCFTGFPGGSRQEDTGIFSNFKDYGFWWSATENNASSSIYRRLDYNNGTVVSGPTGKSAGYSVRLVKEDVPLEPFDYIIVTYQYEPPQGVDYDLDTISTFRYASGTLTGSTAASIQGFIPGTGVAGCGCSPANSDNETIPSNVNINSAYMVYGGDDSGQQTSGSYGESVVINFKNLKDANITTSNDIVVELYAGWHSITASYPITLKYETFIGGIISQEVVGGVTTNRYVTTGTSVSSPQISPPKTITQSDCTSGGIEGSFAKQHVASINYNLVTKVASVIFH